MPRLNSFHRKWIAAASCLLFSAFARVHAAPGDFDVSFGGGTGIVIAAPIAPLTDSLTDSVRRPDGRYLFSGYCNSASLLRAFCISARNADGSVDTSFNGTGTALTQLTTPVGSVAADTALSIALQSDGKAVVSGWCGNSSPDFCVARYNTDGSLDTSFGESGKRFVQFAQSDSSERASKVLIQPDGKILLFGYCNGQAFFCVARLSSAGSLDTTFNATGLVTTDITADLDLAFSAVLLNDGRFVVGGQCRTTPGAPFTAYDYCLVRYSSTGQLDTSFGAGGKVITPVGVEWDRLLTLREVADGKLIGAGQCRVNNAANTGLQDSFCAVRYDANGSVDSTFGAAGKVLISLWPEFRYGGIDVYPDGRLLVSGACRDLTGNGGCAMPSSPGKNRLLLMRLTANGALDASFKGGGVSYFQLDQYASSQPLTNVLLQSDGKIFFSTSCGVGDVGNPNPTGSVFCFARFEGDAPTGSACALDLDGDGVIKLTTDALLHARIALGVPEASRTVGINFPSGAARNTWALINTYLRGLCPSATPYCALDLDGNGVNAAAIDAAIHARIAMGIRNSAVIANLPIAAQSPRGTWETLRAHLGTACGVTGLQP